MNTNLMMYVIQADKYSICPMRHTELLIQYSLIYIKLSKYFYVFYKIF